jgi:hypothetical protein
VLLSCACTGPLRKKEKSPSASKYFLLFFFFFCAGGQCNNIKVKNTSPSASKYFSLLYYYYTTVKHEQLEADDLRRAAARPISVSILDTTEC